MQCGPLRVWLSRLLVGLALALAAPLVLYFAVCQVQHERVERAIRRLEAGPTPGRADQVIQLLHDRMATQDQGERILALLLRPKLTARSAYPVGQPAVVSTELPFPLTFPDGRLELKQCIGDGETFQRAGHLQEPNKLLTWPQFFVVHPNPREPGIYRARIRYTCMLAYQSESAPDRFRFRAWVQEHIGRRSVPASHAEWGRAYVCNCAVPVEMNVVSREKAERLDLVSGRVIDAAMHTVISFTTSPGDGSYATPSGPREYRGTTMITFKTLPVAVAFEVSLHLSDGRELPQGGTNEPQHIRSRADNAGGYLVDVGRFGLEAPGEYTGTLILRPDQDCAYGDPAVKTIWNGTVELPISFSVSVPKETR